MGTGHGWRDPLLAETHCLPLFPSVFLVENPSRWVHRCWWLWEGLAWDKRKLTLRIQSLESFSSGLHLCITRHPLHLYIPVESPSFLPAAWETSTITPRYVYLPLTPYFPTSQWDADAHWSSFVQTKRSLSLSLSLCVSFFFLFASVWKIIIPRKAIHTTKAQWHYSLPRSLFLLFYSTTDN